MHPSLLRALAVTATVATLALPASSHGGQYVAPGDGGAGSASGGGSSAPPTNPGGAAAPGPGAPSSGAGSTGPTSGGGGRGDSRRPTTTGSGQQEFTESYEVWEYWWANNKDAYLDLKNRLVTNTNQSGSIGALTGRGSRSETRSTSRPDEALIQSDVIPAILSLIKDGENQDILDSAVLAVSRISREASAAQVLDQITPMLGHSVLSVQSSTALSMGVLGSPKAIPFLNELMANTSKGRQLTGGGEVHWLVRAFSALSLGLINQPESVDPLIDIIQNTGNTDRDLKACAIVALGLMQDNPSIDKGVAYLVTLLDERGLDPVVKSFVPISLGRLGRTDTAAKILEVFMDRDSEHAVRQSAAIALGLLGTTANVDVLKALTSYIDEGRDMQTRHFCFISLAKIGIRDAEGAVPAAHEQLVELFADEITKPQAKSNRSWAALAAAIYAKDRKDASGPLLLERITQAYKRESDPSFKSAFALSLGLLNASAMQEEIYADFKESRESEFRGYAALALGFLRFGKAADDLRAMVENKTTTPSLRLQVATGLGLMGDPEAAEVLVRALESAQTLGVSSAVAKALGLIGDRTAVEPLKTIMLDTRVTALTRAFACVALGLVCEKTDLPWNARIAADNNYRASVPALSEILDIL